MRASDWVPPVAWMAVIIGLSTDTASSENTGRFLMPALRWILPAATPPFLAELHGILRKLAHVTEYAVLAALWYRAFAAGRRLPPVAAALAVLVSVMWAAVDETVQTLTPSRTASPIDVAIDAVGALLASLVAGTGRSGLVDLAAGVLLWGATIAGGAVLIFNAVVGAGSGAFWVTTAAAALALVARHMAGEI